MGVAVLDEMSLEWMLDGDTEERGDSHQTEA
jgi:hypothetical protein